jgi:hypothetical protein
MNNISETVSESVKYLGQEFLLAYYLPALVFVLAHIYVLIPAWIHTSLSPQRQTAKLTLPLIGQINLTSLIDILLWPLIVGIILFVLNSILIRLFEGMPCWIRKGLLRRLTERNEKNSKKYYSNLVGLRTEYQRVNTLIWQTKLDEEKNILKQQLAGLTQQIDEEHNRIEKLQPRQSLPHDVRRICPTYFGNAFAIAEEYSYERYGVDAVIFWPQLRELMHDKAPSHSLRLTQQKTVLDLSLNFAFLSGLLTFEAVLTAFLTLMFSRSQNLLLLLVLAVISLILSISFYRASVAAVKILGDLIKTSFDYYRGFVLEAFHLKMPDDLNEEQVIWLRLAAFIRRGDAFYFPEEYREPKKKNNGVDEGKKTNE